MTEEEKAERKWNEIAYKYARIEDMACRIIKDDFIKAYLDGLAEGRKEEKEIGKITFKLWESEREKLKKQIEDMQIMEYSYLYEQRKKIHKNLINEFTEQLGIMDKEEDVLFSLKDIKSTIDFILS